MKLAEPIAIRQGDRLIPWIEAGEALPLTKKETLSTARDGQESIRCELMTDGRSLAFVEVGIARAPRGTPKIALTLQIDAHGTATVTLRSDHGEANAMVTVRTM